MDICKIIEERVIGKIVARHDERGHHYLLPSGRLVDSVTTKIILEKKHLTPWAIRQAIEWLEKEGRWERLVAGDRQAMTDGAIAAHTDIRDDAGNVGSAAHQACEDYIKEWIKTNKKPNEIKTFYTGTDYRVVAACRSVQTFFDEHRVEPIASELLVGSERLNSAGTLDFLCYLYDDRGHKRLTLIDLKTSNQIDPIGYSMQIAAYKTMFSEMTGIRIDDCKIILMSKKDDRVTIHTVNRTTKALQAFRRLSAVYDWVRSDEEKITKDVKSKELRW